LIELYSFGEKILDEIKDKNQLQDFYQDLRKICKPFSKTTEKSSFLDKRTY